MKVMSKLSAAALVALSFAGSAMAADGLTVSGDVHGTTAYQFRGEQFSAGEPSLGAKVTAAHTSGLYGSVHADTIKLTGGDNSNQVQGGLTAGYTTDLGHGIKVDGGVSRHVFGGRDSVSDLSFSEAFVGASFQGASLKVASVVESAKADIPGFNRGDTYGELGYTHQFGKLSVGGDVGYRWLNNTTGGARDGLALAQVRASYALNDQVDVSVTHQFAGDDAFGERASGTHKTSVKLGYRF